MTTNVRDLRELSELGIDGPGEEERDDSRKALALKVAGAEDQELNFKLIRHLAEVRMTRAARSIRLADNTQRIRKKDSNITVHPTETEKGRAMEANSLHIKPYAAQTSWWRDYRWGVYLLERADGILVPGDPALLGMDSLSFSLSSLS